MKTEGLKMTLSRTDDSIEHANNGANMAATVASLLNSRKNTEVLNIMKLKIKQLTHGDIFERNGEKVQLISLESNGAMSYRECGTFEVKIETVDFSEIVTLCDRI